MDEKTDIGSSGRRSWLFYGARAEMVSPIRAFLVAPLLALVPTVFILVVKTAGGSGFRWDVVLAIILLALLIAYATTLMIVVPWYLALTRFGLAGLVPMMVSSVLAPVFVFLRAHGHQYTDTGFYAALFFVCGMLISAGFWKIARGET